MTFVPTYLLALAAILLLAAFIVWGFFGSAVSPVIDENGMAHVEATLAPHPHLMPGMTAFVTIEPVK